jgi:hypothetical protein
VQTRALSFSIFIQAKNARVVAARHHLLEWVKIADLPSTTSCSISQGQVIVVRYVDDIAMGFEHEGEAQRFVADMRQRMEKLSATSGRLC